MHETILFENYERFITEHAEEIGSPTGAVRLITDNGMFRAYMSTLTDGLDPDTRVAVMSVANRQREMLLQEAANVPGSSLAFGWTVLSFPILVDIYAEPVISELCNVYPVNASVVSIPRFKIMANIRGYDGNVSQVKMPTLSQSIRPSALNLTIVPNDVNNVFTLASAAVAPATVTPDQYRINRRYTMITKVLVTETTSGGSTIPRNINVSIRPDNRNQFIGTFSFTSDDNRTVVGTLTGNISYDSGVLQFQVIYNTGGSTSTFATTSATLSVRFMAISTMNGRIKVQVQTEMTDVTIDQNEDFMLELPPEDIQDFKSIFKVDIVRVLSEAIKRQILLNKEFDLAYFLSAAETEIAGFGAAQTLNLADYETGGSAGYTPETVLHVFKAIIPKISIVIGTIRKNYNMYPSYIVTGLKTAALLRSLQTFVNQMPGIGQEGILGWAGDVAQFTKLKVLESNAINEGKIYLAVKAPQDSLEKSAIIDLVYQPLYIVTEITDGNTRNFIRSRSLIEVVRADGLGVITVSGLTKYFG